MKNCSSTQVIIMAGGRGSRIASVYSEIPKPMIPICDKPILEHAIDVLHRQDLNDITIVVGYLGKIIMDYFGDGSGFGVNIDYIVEKEPLGTAGALYYLKGKINDDFLLINGDIIYDINFNRLISAHKLNGGLATLFTHPNGHPYDSGVIQADEIGRVVKWLHKEDYRLWYKNRVNAGIHVLSNKILNQFKEPLKTDLDREVLKPLIEQEKLYIYDSPEYVKDMGTPDRLNLVSKDFETGLIDKKNLRKKQKAIFLDRDGTINKYVGFLKNIDQFELMDGVSEAVKKINQSGYLAIVITNQPVIARGEVGKEYLEQIHMKMETLLGQDGAYLDDIFYCPHHPDKGFDGEIETLKIDCSCRKPKPGLIYLAANKYNIDIAESYMVGDSDIDIMTGNNAGCKSIKIGKNEKYKNLLSAIDYIIK